MSNIVGHSKFRRTINSMLFVVFALFAIVQFNDPDSLHWILLYTLVALLSIISNYKVLPRLFVGILIVGFIGYAGLHFSYFMNWLEIEHKDELFGEMVYEKPYLEGTREFLGLLMAAAALSYQLIQPSKS